MPISFDQVGYIYQPDTPFAFQGLKNISFQIEDGDYLAIVGHTGSGKSTLIQHLNALLKPTEGKVTIGDFDITAETKEKQLKPLRKRVGVVFQFPESQLFANTVLEDVMFGPMNFGISSDEAEQLAIEALKMVSVDEALFQRSPFDLSGGQMRRVAIAGILAMRPEVLVLDEPTAGLDPKSRLEMMALFKNIHENYHVTIVLVTHQMNDVANYATKVAVMSKGQLLKLGTPEDIFSDRQWLIDHEIGLPSSLEMAYRLSIRGVQMRKNLLTTEQLLDELTHILGG